MSERSKTSLTLVVDGDIVGHLPWSGQLAAGTHSVVGTSDAYITDVQTVSIAAGQVTSIDIVARPRASISVSAHPVPASVTIDDRLVGQTPAKSAVGPGRHSLVVAAPGYRSWVEDVAVAEGETKARFVRLEPETARDRTPSEGIAPSDRSTRWYGWQTLALDGAAVAVLSAGLASWTVEPSAIGYGALLLGAPAVHASHRNLGRAFGSLGLRVLVPALTGGIGAGVSLLTARPSLLESKSDDAVLDLVTKAGIGMAVGGAVCVVLDASVLSWQSEDRATSAAQSRRPSLSIGLVAGSRVGVQGAF